MIALGTAAAGSLGISPDGSRASLISGGLGLYISSGDHGGRVTSPTTIDPRRGSSLFGGGQAAPPVHEVLPHGP